MFIIENDYGDFYKNIKWVSKAICKDKTRMSICGIYVEKLENTFRFIATDGKRLHMVEYQNNIVPDTWEEGLWEVKVSPERIIFLSEIEGDFPNYKRVIPDYKNEKDTIIKIPLKKESYKFTMAYYELIQLKVLMVISNIEDISNYEWNVKVAPDDPNKKAVEFKCDNKTVIIMPIGLNEDIIPVFFNKKKGELL